MALKEDFEEVVDIRQMKVERIWVLFGVPVGVGEALAREAKVFSSISISTVFILHRNKTPKRQEPEIDSGSSSSIATKDSNGKS